MVIVVLKNNKSSNILNDSFKERMNSYFNPYEYDFDFINNAFNSDIIAMKSKSHNERKRNVRK